MPAGAQCLRIEKCYRINGFALQHLEVLSEVSLFGGTTGADRVSLLCHLSPRSSRSAERVVARITAAAE